MLPVWERESLFVHDRLAKVGEEACLTVIRIDLVVDRAGEPLSVAVKVMLNVVPSWVESGLKVKVPLAGFPVTGGKLIPGTSPAEVRVIMFIGRSLSVALTENVVVVLMVAATDEGAEITGGTLTSLTVIETDRLVESAGDPLSVAVNDTV